MIRFFWFGFMRVTARLCSLRISTYQNTYSRMSQSPSALSNQSLKTTPEQKEETTQKGLTSNDRGNSMAVYYKLQRTLYLYTLTLMGIMFIPVWYFFSLNIALNYGLGAVVSVVYLRFLAKDVERLGQPQQRLGVKGLGIFVVLIVAASKLPQLQVIPVFLGFLTYKEAIIIYMLQPVFWPNTESTSDSRKILGD